jgi:branched-chain amino acid transport system ATP-binding protein
MNLLEVRGVSKHFGGLYALNGLDFVVERGEILSIIGPNGAGKSTVFKRSRGSTRGCRGHRLRWAEPWWG